MEGELKTFECEGVDVQGLAVGGSYSPFWGITA